MITKVTKQITRIKQRSIKKDDFITRTRKHPMPFEV